MLFIINLTASFAELSRESWSPPAALWACPGLYWDSSFRLHNVVLNYRKHPHHFQCSFEIKKISKYSYTAVPFSVAARSKAWLCDLSLAGITGSNSACSMDVFPLGVLCVLSGRGLSIGLKTRPEKS